MNKIIYKYMHEVADKIELVVPDESTLLHIECLRPNLLTFWYECPYTSETGMTDTHTYYVYGTGKKFEKVKGSLHVESVIDGPFVWHIYADVEWPWD